MEKYSPLGLFLRVNLLPIWEENPNDKKVFEKVKENVYKDL